MEKMELFNRLTLAIFDQLYQNFPCRIDLEVEHLAMQLLGEQEQADPDSIDADLIWDILSACGYTVEFLRDEGFITYDSATLSEACFLRMRLTLKGLTLLGQSPASLQENDEVPPPLSERIKDALTEGGKTATTEGIKLLVKQIFHMAVGIANK